MLYGATQQGQGSSSSSSGRGSRSKAIAANLGKICLAGAAVVSVALYWSRGGFHIASAPNGNESEALQQAHDRVDDKASGSSSGAESINLRQSGERGASGWYPVVELDYSWQFKGAVALKSERIAFCPIQKVACTEWLKVLRWIDGQSDWEEPRHHKHGLDMLQELGTERGNEILNSPEWLKFAVVREPAERLLSCFLQKCTPWNMRSEYGNCPYLEIWPELFSSTHFPNGMPGWPGDETHAWIRKAFNDRGKKEMFHGYVMSITQRVKVDPCNQNGHWSPQFCHCSLDVTAPAFQIVGWNNMTEAVAAAIVPSATSRQRGSEIAEFLDGRMRENHERKGKKTEAGRSVLESYSEVSLQAVHEAYRKDYELFSDCWE